MPSFYSLKSMLGVVLLVVMGTTATVDLQAQTRYRSLWDKRDDRKAFLFRDIKARNVGDNLTIAI
ncbi:MAG: flagellar basal body L-ring protein FlgH, partial [Planctomycetaceae bacterium]|nr:flagellar basal body L-ring protein FlgH [Planctomycetaceae bacterium]